MRAKKRKKSACWKKKKWFINGSHPAEKIALENGPVPSNHRNVWTVGHPIVRPSWRMVPGNAASCSCLVYYQRLRAFPVNFKAALHLQHPTAPCGSCTNQTCMCLCVISECIPECKTTDKGLSLVALLLSGMSIPTKSEVSLTEYLIYFNQREVSVQDPNPCIQDLDVSG